MYRNYKLNELRIENVGEEVVLSGWVSKVRDLGHFTFIDLRDRYGITQILVNEEGAGKELFEEAKKSKGILKKEEIYFFAPALIAGGAEELKYVDKGDAAIHHEILFQWGT